MRKGIEQGRALAVIDLLELRGVALDEPSRERILACHDADTLRRWLVRASTAQRVDEVFGA